VRLLQVLRPRHPPGLRRRHLDRLASHRQSPLPRLREGLLRAVRLLRAPRLNHLPGLRPRNLGRQVRVQASRQVFRDGRLCPICLSGTMSRSKTWKRRPRHNI
jgi:hypothetical protein